MKILFWNTHSKAPDESIARIMKTRVVDLAILLEYVGHLTSLLEMLNRESVEFHLVPSLVEDRFVFLSRFDSSFFPIAHESPRLVLRRLSMPALPELLIGTVHGPDMRNHNSDARLQEAFHLVQAVREAEGKVGHARTVLVGDFNASPYEPAMVTAAAFNAMPSRKIAARIDRTVQNRTYPFFYNPMWSRLGDDSKGPPGTFYYDGGDATNVYWYMLDQVLLRPEALPLSTWHSLRF
ncbi:MAG: endonuclease/exonuclease/phosphatase family protein [Planctomycetota bacterium]|nr:endonuclease/exonuclease/phosphatase family protein [Planctomycetota bacterium]